MTLQPIPPIEISYKISQIKLNIQKSDFLHSAKACSIHPFNLLLHSHASECQSFTHRLFIAVSRLYIFLRNCCIISLVRIVHEKYRPKKEEKNYRIMNRDDPPMPRYGKTAVELLDSKYAEPHSLSSKYGTRFALGIFGIGMIIGDNWAKQRPMKAGT